MLPRSAAHATAPPATSPSSGEREREKTTAGCSIFFVTRTLPSDTVVDAVGDSEGVDDALRLAVDVADRDADSVGDAAPVGAAEMLRDGPMSDAQGVPEGSALALTLAE